MAVATVAMADGHQPGTKTATWAAMASGDTGTPVDISRWGAASIQCTAGTIGTSTLQGSNDGAVWGAIGAGLTIAAANRVDLVPIGVRFVRPNVGAGGTGAIVVLSLAQPSV